MDGLEGPEPSPSVRDRMKKAFAECYRAVLACDDGSGRIRCELFRKLPDKNVCLLLSTVNLLKKAHFFLNCLGIVSRLFYYHLRTHSS